MATFMMTEGKERMIFAQLEALKEIRYGYRFATVSLFYKLVLIIVLYGSLYI